MLSSSSFDFNLQTWSNHELYVLSYLRHDANLSIPWIHRPRKPLPPKYFNSIIEVFWRYLIIMSSNYHNMRRQFQSNLVSCGGTLLVHIHSTSPKHLVIKDCMNILINFFLDHGIGVCMLPFALVFYHLNKITSRS